MKRKTALFSICVGLMLLAPAISMVLAQPDPDINNDGIVDTKDIAIVSLAFGSFPGHLKWNPDADVNADLKVDIKDVAIVASYFGTQM